MFTADEKEDFLLGYIECALWSSTDEDENPLDDKYGRADLDLDTFLRLEKECGEFIDANMTELHEYCEHRSMGDAGHDFWLTRNGHGAGFWDRGLGEVGTKLTEASKVYGEQYLCPVADKIVVN